MQDGWLAMFNPYFLLSFVLWQPNKPGYVRFLPPKGSERVIGLLGCPKAQICRGCKTVVFSYAKDQLN
jgi:hypothetical protein